MWTRLRFLLVDSLWKPGLKKRTRPTGILRPTPHHTPHRECAASSEEMIDIDPFLAWVESTALSQWVVGSPSMFAFPGILVLHAIGMGFAVGVSVAIDLRILGVASRVPLAEMRRFLPVLWAGFWLNAASGVLLLIGYPTKALTNPCSI